MVDELGKRDGRLPEFLDSVEEMVRAYQNTCDDLN